MKKFKWFMKEVGIYILVIVVVILFRCYVAALIKVNGTSMMDTLHNKDIMILDKISYHFRKIKRFDIVVIDLDNEFIIKRVIGLPGEHIEYKDDTLYVNGKKIEEDFYHKKTDDFSLEDLDSTEVPEDCYFVLGDNRQNSMDSRIIGFIPKDKIMGLTSFTILPFSRFGFKY